LPEIIQSVNLCDCRLAINPTGSYASSAWSLACETMYCSRQTPMFTYHSAVISAVR